MPAGLNTLKQALGCVGCQRRASSIVDRQASRNQRHGGQIQLVTADFAARRVASFSTEQSNPDIATGPMQAISSREGQRLGKKLIAAVKLLGAQAPRHACHGDRLQPGVDFDIDIGQGHVRGGAGHLTTHHLDPGAYRPGALRYVDPQIKVLAQLGHIQTIRLGECLALPLAPVAGVACQQRLPENTADAQARTPRGRRVGVHPDRVGAQAFAHHHIHIAQLHSRNTAQFIRPAHGAVAHDQLALREYPISGGAIGASAFGDFKPGNPEAAVAGAPHVQTGRMDVDLLKTEAHSRAWRQRRHHRRQQQRLTTLAIHQTHINELNGRYQAVGTRDDVADHHFGAQHAGSLLLQPRAQFADSRHNQKMQSTPHQK